MKREFAVSLYGMGRGDDMVGAAPDNLQRAFGALQSRAQIKGLPVNYEPHRWIMHFRSGGHQRDGSLKS
jgi:hypothetical protein